MKVVVFLLVAVLIGAVAGNYALSKTPAVEIDPALKVLGASTPVTIGVTSPHGIRQFTAWIEQGGSRHVAHEETRPARRLSIFRTDEGTQKIDFTVRKSSELKDGPAKLIFEVSANDFAAKKATATVDVQINTTPPTVAADGLQHYINQGGAELVTFTAGGYWTEAGVRVGKYTFRSFPMPGKGENERFSLFAFPWDVPVDTVPIVFARNPAGTEVTAQFWHKIFPRKFRSRDLELDDRFLQKVVNELDPQGSGTPVERFLKINGELRRQNNQTLSDLRMSTEPAMLWKGPFFRLGKVEAFFADQRTYMYGGKKIDTQMHLGFDLSDVKAAPVRAANAGRVIYAEPLGIYGNCVVIDHGYGLQTIYGHMSRIGVKRGDMVAKEQEIGRSGETGLAGGDHLHFSMQIDGVQVNAIEWWDDHWIRDRVLSKIGG